MELCCEPGVCFGGAAVPHWVLPVGHVLGKGTMRPLHTSLPPGNKGQEQRKQPQAVQGSIRTDVRNSFSLKEWPGSVRSCLWRWWGHHPWQCSRAIWMWHLGHGYGEIVVVLEGLCCGFCDLWEQCCSLQAGLALQSAVLALQAVHPYSQLGSPGWHRSSSSSWPSSAHSA